MLFVLPTVAPTIVLLDDLLSLRARTHPDRPAIRAAGGDLTYAQLDDLAGAAARRLAALGVAPGDRVATMLPAGVDLAVLLHAVPKLGAVLAPLNTRLTAGERSAQVEQAAPRVMIEGPLDGSEAELPAHRRLAPEEAWTLLFTSGTTGAPRPVLLSHRNHLASALGAAWALGVAPDERWLCVLPLFHVGGLAVLIRSALWGTTAVVHDGFDAERAGQAIEAGEVTLASLVPTMLRRLADGGLEAAPTLRAILLGGAAAPRGLLEWAATRGLPVVRTYGMTEAASQVATAPLGDGHERPGARPLPGVELRISGRGEVMVRGPMVARGALAPDGWLHTGDRGSLDAGGLLHVDGRLDDVIVSGGENVVAGEVEEALLSHPAVRDAGVVGAPDREWGQAIVAYVVATEPASPEELRAHCRGRIAGYKVPKQVLLVDALPRNAAGKLERPALAGAARGAARPCG